jgi:hypothetical protein
MVQIWRPWDNFCAFETLSKMADLNLFFCSDAKTPIFLLPYYTLIHALSLKNYIFLEHILKNVSILKYKYTHVLHIF